MVSLMCSSGALQATSSVNCNSYLFFRACIAFHGALKVVNDWLTDYSPMCMHAKGCNAGGSDTDVDPESISTRFLCSSGGRLPVDIAPD